MQDQIYLERAGVKVSDSMLIVHGKTYSLENVESVKVREGGGAPFAGCFLLAGGIVLVISVLLLIGGFESSDEVLRKGLPTGLVTLGIGILLRIFARPTFWIELHLSSRWKVPPIDESLKGSEVSVPLSSKNKALIDEVANAISKVLANKVKIKNDL